MTHALQSIVRRSFNGSSHGQRSHITDGHKAVFLALTSGEPNFCLTSLYVNGRPAVAIVLLGRNGERVEIAPCFVSITPGMKLRAMDGTEYEWDGS